ncbi:antibiotic biosynthesis monooxygenase [Ichthyenterobacterium sp. W332]|uniref:Antibiotic biosynthesis monooxygenase n=1 Tax=Microcosmobacter mediterraneus TaxID=3075607 RepID=A0ABU2YJ47_9FLAO|nr:antibiotic biosynthesis monooxygenase [Ichthyenterobacterium sp. W332]MDT0558181.1 antibiotic biosynthesis monooxygenase [Ichthyenterobacterium sp. W332]
MNSSFKPYYAVIFTSKQAGSTEGYSKMSEEMEELAKQQKGYLGIESAKSQLGITISYWENLESIRNWKEQSDHLIAQQKGRSDWYSWYHVRICKVEREYEFNKKIIN